ARLLVGRGAPQEDHDPWLLEREGIDIIAPLPAPAVARKVARDAFLPLKGYQVRKVIARGVDRIPEVPRCVPIPLATHGFKHIQSTHTRKAIARIVECIARTHVREKLIPSAVNR